MTSNVDVTFWHHRPVVPASSSKGYPVRNTGGRRAGLSPRRAVAAVLAAVTAVGLAACGGSSSGGGEAAAVSSSSPQAAKGSLTVLVEGGGHAELQPVADLFKQQTGNSVTFVELPYAGNDWLVREVLAEAGDAAILSPESARDAVHAAASKLAAALR